MVNHRCVSVIWTLLFATSVWAAAWNAMRGDDQRAGLTETTASDDSAVEAVSLVQPPQPRLPDRALPPLIESPAAAEAIAQRFFGPLGAARSLLSENRRARASGPSTDFILGAESKLRLSSDTGSLLGKSPSALGVGVQRRTPIVTDPRTRGRSMGQQLASGSYWFPAREDLDTLLNKIDSRIIEDVIVIRGPYSVLYGPGFSYYDVRLRGAPRYDGFEAHGSSSLNYQTAQWYARQVAVAGDCDWGVRLGYGHRTGSDYETGDDFEIPSSYKSRDMDLAIGIDLSPDSRIEFTVLRLDQSDVEFPGQPFDIDFLVTDAYEVEYTHDNAVWCDWFTLDAWYNRTRFEGNAQRSGKRQQIPVFDDPLRLIAFTDSDATSIGFQAAANWGDADCALLTLGADLRYLKQELNELDFSPRFGTSRDRENFNFPIPDSHSSNPGLFAAYRVPLGERIRIQTGTRADWVSTNADDRVANTDLDNNGQQDDLEQSLGGGFSQNFALGSGFAAAEYLLDDHWSATLAGGFAMRPPRMTELYAGQTFLAILQQGVSFVSGDPNLDPERLWQIDVGLRGELDRLRLGLTGFHAWVNDYITDRTFATFPGVPDALGVFYTNTDLATLTGGEIYGEYDWNDWLTPFASLSYVEGRDHSRDDRGPIEGFSNEEPLPGIVPLESRVGQRIHQAEDDPRWGIEASARIVDHQDRVATSLFERDSLGSRPTTRVATGGRPTGCS